MQHYAEVRLTSLVRREVMRDTRRRGKSPLLTALSRSGISSLSVSADGFARTALTAVRSLERCVRLRARRRSFWRCRLIAEACRPLPSPFSFVCCAMISSETMGRANMMATGCQP